MFTPCKDIAKTNVIIKDLACSIRELADALKNPGSSSGDIGDASAKNEVIELTGETTYTLVWDSTRQTNFGDSPVISMWLQDSGGAWLYNAITPTIDDPLAPSNIVFNFGSPSNAVIIIS